MGNKSIIPYIFLILFCLASTTIHAQQDMSQNIQEASSELEIFFEGIPHDSFLVITGSRISIEDKIFFNLLKDNIDVLQGIKVMSDEKAIDSDEFMTDTLILLGSYRTNLATKTILEEEGLQELSESDYSPLILKYRMLDGRKVLTLFSQKEVVNNENNAIERSPLSNIMDPRLVPVAATSISLILIYLYNVLGKTFFDLVNEFITSHIIDRKASKKKITKSKVEHRIKAHEFINRHEVIAFIVTVIIFSLTMAWTWSENMSDFLDMFLLNIAVVGLISFAREAIRLFFCYKEKLRSEYVLWPFGALTTLVSTYLGNTFAMCSYTLLDEDEADIKRFGKLSFMIVLATMAFSAAAYLINIATPSLILQMAFVYAIMVVFIELFPFSPMPGKDIRKWNLPLYIITYLAAFAMYLAANFTVYV